MTEVIAKTFGKYTIEKKLGQGGMGVVYLAQDSTLGRKVAIKIITVDDPEMLARFQQEAQAVARLKHPNIIQVYEAGNIGKQHYFAMDYIDGTSLDGLIKTDKLSAQSIARVILQVALALAYAHKHNIVHRDIKPANILIDKRGKVYLADFGLAKQLSGLDRSLTVTGTTVGTPDYMSPEQAMGKKDEIDPRSDIFSLGATLYHCLSGQLPFPGKELYDVLTKVINEDPFLPSVVIPLREKKWGIPRDLETICMKCLDKDKKQRYQSAPELALDLKRYLTGEPITGRRTSYFIKLWVRAKRNKVASIGIASAVMVLIVVLVIGLISAITTARKLEQFRTEAYRYFYEQKDMDNAWAACQKILEIKFDKDISELSEKCEEEMNSKNRNIKDLQRQSERRANAKTVLDRVIGASTPDQRIKAARDALKIDQNFGDAYQVMGYAYKDKGDTEKAYEYFSQAVAIAPTLAYSYYERGLISNIRNELSEAIADFKKVLEYDPKSHIGYFAKGMIEGEQEQYDAAIQSYSQAIVLYPKYPEAFLNRGCAYAEKSELDKAIADYNEAIRLNPGFDMTYYNRGNAYFQQNELTKAFADYTAAIRMNPRYDSAYANRALIHDRMGNLDEAIADAGEAIRLNNQSYKAYYNRGLVYLKKGELPWAIADFTDAIRLVPAHAEAYHNRGIAYSQKADRVEQSSDEQLELFDKAIADYDQSIKLNVADPAYYYSRSLAYYNKAERESSRNIREELMEKAMADCTAALRLNPNYADIYVNRGAIYAAQGELDRALVDLDRAIELNTTNREWAYYVRANVQARKGNFTAALADAELFFQIAVKPDLIKELKQSRQEWEQKVK